MRWRFWEPDPTGLPWSASVLPPRRMNLTEMRTFAEYMGEVMGSKQYVLREGLNHKDVAWESLVTLLPDQLATLYIVAAEGEPAPSGLAPTTPHFHLALGSPDRPATLAGAYGAETRRPQLEERWNQLGGRRRSWAWLYPAGFLLGLLAATAPLIVLWVHHQLSLWLIPLVIVVLLMAFAVGAPLLQRAVGEHRRSRSGLSIHFRLIEQVRRDRAAVHLAVWSGVGGAVTGAVIAALATWLWH
ncbi:hypothetical protein ACI79D_14830 [Geodermatophilus sp. SYSU D00708]